MKMKQIQNKPQPPLEVTIATVAILLMILETLISTHGLSLFFN